MKVIELNGKKICIGGVGELYFTEGLPISMTMTYLKSKGIDTSILHVADELYKNGFGYKTIISKLIEDFADSGSETLDKEILTKFVTVDYETQREMLFDSLFKSRAEAYEYLKNNYK